MLKFKYNYSLIMLLRLGGLLFLVGGFVAIIVVVAVSGTDDSDMNEDLSYIRALKVKKIIVDVDAGVDDAFALLLLLAHQHENPNYPKIIAITCTHGNTHVEQVAVNVLKTLRILGLEKKIPVYIGANYSLTTTPKTEDYFGKDAFGDVPDPDPPSIHETQTEHAVNALMRLVKNDPENVAIIALGPLTNLALATRMDPHFRKNVQIIFWMGGSIEGHRIDFNAAIDPEANFIVMNTQGSPVVLFPSDSCTRHGFTPTKWRLDVLGKLDSVPIHFLNAIEAIALKKDPVMWEMCDGKTMAVVFERKIITKISRHNVYALYKGDDMSRGAVMVDYDDETDRRKNAFLIQEIDVKLFQDLCLRNLR